VIRSFRASRMITMCVTHFRCSSARITCMHVILPCFFKELELYLCIWYIYIIVCCCVGEKIQRCIYVVATTSLSICT